ncbi:unnamed protein product [Brassica oleracea]|uniref:(rape) hypothetical protein n=1 Tax=Brassica napus TaxID=3708 RepID=A0A816K541_BRANA|nr:unnamed protein product [Brassica napus]
MSPLPNTAQIISELEYELEGSINVCPWLAAPYSTFVVPNSPLYYATSQGRHEVNQFVRSQRFQQVLTFMLYLLVESGVDIINLWNYRRKAIALLMALMQACQHGHWEDTAFRVYNKCPQFLEPVEE